MVILNPTVDAIGKIGFSLDGGESRAVSDKDGAALLAEFPTLLGYDEPVVKEAKVIKAAKKAAKPKK